MNEEQKLQKRKALAIKLGLTKDNERFHRAFDCTIIKKGADGSKGIYENSALATVGDSVIRLVLSKKFFDEKKSSGEITWERTQIEKGKNLKKIAQEYKLDKLTHGKKAQSSDNLCSNGATLFEAIIGALFSELGYDRVAEILIENFELTKERK